MGVNLARYGPVVRSARRWSGAALLAAALLGSFGLAWLVVGALVLAFPANMTAEERWFGGGMVAGFGVLPVPAALLILAAGVFGRRRLSRLRQLAAVVRETRPQLPVLLVSGYAELPSTTPALALHRLAKPFTPDQLLDAIEQLRGGS